MHVGRFEVDGEVHVAELGGDLLHVTEFRSMRRFIEDRGDATRAELDIRTAELGGQLRALAPIDDPRKIVAIGLNYADHAAEGAVEVPHEPLIFAKFPSSIVGPGASITWDPTLAKKVDFEAELAVVIGTRARNVPEQEALRHVFGYTCLNDVTARDLQFADGQWVRAKSLDTFCPLGPLIVTADEIPNPNDLAIRCVLSGEVMQVATTSDMLFSIEELVSRLSRAFVLEPGDLIATGTPPGVGWFRTPPRLLRDGDVVTVQIEGIGELANPVVLGHPAPSSGIRSAL